MKRERENDIVVEETSAGETTGPTYWLPNELFSVVLLHAIQYSMLDEDQYKRLVRYRRVCKSWAYDIVAGWELIAQVRHWDFQMMRSILFWTDESSPFSINNPSCGSNNNTNNTGEITDTAARLFAGCQSLCVCHHYVPRWLQKVVPRLPLLHSIWFEVCHGEWPAGWTTGCLALKRLVLNGTMWIGVPEEEDGVESPPLPLGLETLWILAWPQCQIDKLCTEKMAALKYYTGPHLREQFFDKGLPVVSMCHCPDPGLHYTRYMPKTVQSRPLTMRDFIMRGCNCPHCLQ